MPPRWGSIALLIAALAAPCPAAAQPSLSIAGVWRLETSPQQETGCIIRGDATVSAGAGAKFDVVIDVRETCPDGSIFSAAERCTADQRGDRVAVACRVVRAGPAGYLADQFALRLRGDTMVGRLADAGHWNDPVIWRRAPAALVS
jgi:hypothetical protein